MRIGVLGTGSVGQALSARFRALGHDVAVGSRSAGPATVTFADAARHSELVVNATRGSASLAALTLAGAENLAGKVLVDVANPIAGFGTTVVLEPVCTDSLAERIQRTFPDARVVKTLNTVNAAVMTHPDSLPGAHDVFLAGEDAAAKDTVRDLLRGMGWPEASIRDLGGLTAARALEMYLGLWLALAGSLGRFDLNIRVVVPD